MQRARLAIRAAADYTLCAAGVWTGTSPTGSKAMWSLTSETKRTETDHQQAVTVSSHNSFASFYLALQFQKYFSLKCPKIE